jgi:hypothetical protein
MLPPLFTASLEPHGQSIPTASPSYGFCLVSMRSCSRLPLTHHLEEPLCLLGVDVNGRHNRICAQCDTLAQIGGFAVNSEFNHAVVLADLWRDLQGQVGGNNAQSLGSIDSLSIGGDWYQARDLLDWPGRLDGTGPSIQHNQPWRGKNPSAGIGLDQGFQHFHFPAAEKRQ